MQLAHYRLTNEIENLYSPNTSKFPKSIPFRLPRYGSSIILFSALSEHLVISSLPLFTMAIYELLDKSVPIAVPFPFRTHSLSSLFNPLYIPSHPLF